MNMVMWPRARGRIVEKAVRVLCFVVLAFSASLVRAVDSVIVSVQNNTGVFVSDLHVTFTGTGGNITVPPVTVFAFGCPVPAVPSNGAVTNTAVIDWGVACVAPGSWVHFNAQTTNGPLAIASARWTLFGNFIGAPAPARSVRIGPLGGFPPGPFWVWGMQSRIGPWGGVRYTPWRRPPGRRCWQRWCCRPAGRRFTRAVLYCYANRFGRIVRIGPCVPLTPWRRDGFRAAKYRWRFTTIRPVGVIGNGGDGPLVLGPPKDEENPMPDEYGPQDRFMAIGSTDDNGATYRSGYDFAACFADIGMAMEIDDEGTPELTPTDMFQRLSPGYIEASQALARLSAEINDVVSSEPNAVLSNINSSVLQLQFAMQGIAAQLATGFPTNAAPFEQARQACANMASQFPLLNANPRFQSGQDNLNRITEGFLVARDRVSAGLGTPTNMDDFLWALFMRIAPTFPVLASTCEPCVRYRYGNANQFVWNFGLTHGMTASIHDGTNFNLIDSFMLPMNDDSHVFLPISDLVPGQQAFVSLGHDRMLSGGHLYVPADGNRFFFNPMPAGDVTGDNRIMADDVAAVNATMGQGGLDAGSVPSTDVNNDGLVNAQDLNMVNSFLGATGGGYVDIYGHISLEGWTGLTEDQSFTVEIRDQAGVVLDTQEVMTTNDPLQPAINYSLRSGWIGDLQISVKAPRWLRRTTNVNVPQYGFMGVNFFMLTGDIDDDNEVAIGDFAVLSAGFGAAPGDPNWDEMTDLNGDETTDIGDYALMSTNFGFVGDN